MRYYLDGDLNQLIIQRKYLVTECRGFELKHEEVRPYLESYDEYKRAICCIWLDKVEGFWNYKDELINMGEVTEKKFFEVLKERVCF